MQDAPEELKRLRAELDQLDTELLSTASRRCEVVKRIAQAKASAGQQSQANSGHRLFDREREKEVYKKCDGIAKKVGLDQGVARRLMQSLIEGSHEIQEGLSRDRAMASGTEKKRVLIVGGKGAMGRRLSLAFEYRGHSVDVYDVDDARDKDTVVKAADVVMIAVPMSVVLSVVADIGPRLRPDALLCDINSLKSQVCEALETHAPGEAVGLHPMFGPSVHSMRRQKVVVCHLKRGPLGDWLERELSQMGAELIDSQPEVHDRMMAVVQVMVHYSTIVMGEALRRSDVTAEESLRYTSPIYRLELALVGRLFAQKPELYAEIEMSNPFGDEIRARYLSAAADFNQTIVRGDRDEFVQKFREISGYFKEFSTEAMETSDYIIDSLVRQP